MYLGMGADNRRGKKKKKIWRHRSTEDRWGGSLGRVHAFLGLNLIVPIWADHHFDSYAVFGHNTHTQPGRLHTSARVLSNAVDGEIIKGREARKCYKTSNKMQEKCKLLLRVMFEGEAESKAH